MSYLHWNISDPGCQCPPLGHRTGDCLPTKILSWRRHAPPSTPQMNILIQVWSDQRRHLHPQQGYIFCKKVSFLTHLVFLGGLFINSSGTSAFNPTETKKQLDPPKKLKLL